MFALLCITTLILLISLTNHNSSRPLFTDWVTNMKPCEETSKQLCLVDEKVKIIFYI